MRDLRRHTRITDTPDLIARIRSPGRPPRAVRILNLSQGGMLVHGLDLNAREAFDFELDGPHFRYAGVAAAVHHRDGATGLRFLTWRGPVELVLGDLIARRVRQPESSPRVARDRRAEALINKH